MTTAPHNFSARDWTAPEHNTTAPQDRFEIFDGPTAGGIESNWQPNTGVRIDLPELGPMSDGLDVSVADARKLRDDLTALLDQLD